jgi:acyl-CoA thioester hydrolase
LDPGPVELEERVRYAETDAMGVAHHKNYFVWFEAGRTEFCRRRGLSYRKVEASGLFIVVVEAACHYKKPLRYDDRFVIRTTLREATPKKIAFDYEILSHDSRKVMATGHTFHLVLDRQGRVSPLPQDVLDKLAGPNP